MDYTEILCSSPLFGGVSKSDADKMLKCLHAEYREYEKNEIILWEGDEVTKAGIVLSGKAHSVKTDVSGKTFIVTVIEKYGYIGVLLAASHSRKSPVTVQAAEKMSVLFFQIDRILKNCQNVCDCHLRLLSNYIDALAEKALILHDRNDCLIKPTVREKILTYLMRTSQTAGNRSFSIPLDRNAMAEYLNVDRSALSRELSSMKIDGLIDFYKNSFKLT